MTDDERCCGTGTCIIDAQGHCWCGQVWDGEKMCRPTGSAGASPAKELARSGDEEKPLPAK